VNPELATILARVSQREGVPPALLLGVLASMGEASGKPDFTRIENNLARRAGDFCSLKARLGKPSGADPERDRLQVQAVQALANGQLAEADRLLAQAEQRNLDGAAAPDALSRDRLLAAAAGRADRGAVAMLHLNSQAYRDAAERYAEAALIADSAEAGGGLVYSWMQADALARRGADFSDKSAFVAAIGQLRGMLDKLDNFNETVPWAETQLRLARSLTGLSHYEGGGALLRQVVEIYRTTLEDLPRTKAPRLWAALQTRLGEALARLGELEDDASLLDDGVAAFRAGLSGLTRADMPREWGRLQWELGKAHVALGQRASGVAAFEAAVNCFKLVLDDRPRESVPLEWAEVQDRIGVALIGLATYYSEPVVLEEAIAAFDAALEVRRREIVPSLWADSAGNRAEARLALAERLRERAEAEKATTELVMAIETLRGLGLAAEAKRREPKLLKAAALVETFRKR
jgi:tetratricopeptide (TPR) repeat protein